MRYLGLVFLSLLLCFSLPVRAQDAESAKMFVRSIYGREQGGDFEYFGKSAKYIFSESLLALMDHDQELAHGRLSTWVVGGDPFCECQNIEGFILGNVSAQLGKSGEAHAVASYSFNPAYPPKKAQYDLVFERGGWRINDVSNDHLTSFRKKIQNSIASYKQDAQ
ncbi:MAG: hypothetical protein WCD70_01570 [Alphaproteobacteria bacterium]